MIFLTFQGEQAAQRLNSDLHNVKMAVMRTVVEVVVVVNLRCLPFKSIIHLWKFFACAVQADLGETSPLSQN